MDPEVEVYFVVPCHGVERCSSSSLQ
eukprot:SAG22_NODE_12392_length_444_cov_1.052174_2_plen_25_part_01